MYWDLSFRFAAAVMGVWFGLGQCLFLPSEPAWDLCHAHANGPCTGRWNVLKPLWCHWLLLFLCQCLSAVSCSVHRHRLFGAEAVHSLDVYTVQGVSVLISC